MRKNGLTKPDSSIFPKAWSKYLGEDEAQIFDLESHSFDVDRR